MSTNFYMCSKRMTPKHWSEGTELVRGHFGLHIAIILHGWEPLFKEYSFIKSVKELEKEYNLYECTIYDESGHQYDWHSFEELFINHIIAEAEVKSHMEEESPEVLEHYFKDPEGYEFLKQ